MKVFWIEHDRLDPPWNLAAEEYLITQKTGSFAMLWRNSRSVIIGRNQDYESEVNTAYCAQNGIAVVRRLSGGGAVFHDLGNVNYSYITSDKVEGFAGFAKPLIAALGRMGVDAVLSGRNDLLVEDKKVSGCAHGKLKNRLLYHGTLLFSADLSAMRGALRAHEDKYQGRGIASVASRVANLSQWLDMSVEDFMAALRKELLSAQEMEPYVLTDADVAAIDKLRDEKYSSPAWTDGGLRGADHVGRIRCGGGILEARLRLDRGTLKTVRFTGDYFGTEPVETLEQALTGLRYDRQTVAAALDQDTIQAVMHNVTTDDILTVMFVD